MDHWTDCRRTLALAVFYSMAMLMITGFTLRNSFAVPSFVYQNF